MRGAPAQRVRGGWGTVRVSRATLQSPSVTVPLKGSLSSTYKQMKMPADFSAGIVHAINY